MRLPTPRLFCSTIPCTQSTFKTMRSLGVRNGNQCATVLHSPAGRQADLVLNCKLEKTHLPTLFKLKVTQTLAPAFKYQFRSTVYSLFLDDNMLKGDLLRCSRPLAHGETRIVFISVLLADRIPSFEEVPCSRTLCKQACGSLSYLLSALYSDTPPTLVTGCHLEIRGEDPCVKDLTYYRRSCRIL